MATRLTESDLARYVLWKAWRGYRKGHIDYSTYSEIVSQCATVICMANNGGS